MHRNPVAASPTGVTVEIVGTPEDLRAVWQNYKRQVKSLGPDVVTAASELVRDWSDLTPKQQRRFGPLNIRHAPQILRLLPGHTTTARPRGREHRARRRSSARRTRVGASRDGPDDPEPEPDLHVIQLAVFRRELRRVRRGEA